MSRICLHCEENETPDGYEPICLPCYENAGDYLKDNIHRIKAIPALLEACKMSLQDARDALSGEWVPSDESWKSIIDDLERVIAKAEDW